MGGQTSNRLKDDFNNLRTLLGRRTISEMRATVVTEEAGIYKSFLELPNYSKKFYFS